MIRALNSLSSLFSPKHVAVVGASEDTNKIRGRLLKLLRTGGFAGAIYPVNPSSSTIQGLQAYPNVLALPEAVDLALIAVAAPQVMEVLEQCAGRGIKAAAIFSAGASNASHGERLQDRVAAFARRTGMRILGPNAEGFIDIESGMTATFSPTLEAMPAPPHGSLPLRSPVSIVSQSGAMAFALYSRACHEHIPIGRLVSTGNEADVEMLEVVDHLIAQGTSKAILLFLEGFRDPERFASVAARAADAGVVLVVAKVGQSMAGQRAAVSHTAHLTGADTAYEAAFRRYGVIRVDNPEQMLAIAAAVSVGAQPQGKRVGIITTSGGAGGWAADICERAGLDVPELTPALKQELAAIVPDYGSSENPVDVTAHVVEDGGATLMRILELLERAPDLDVGLIIVSLVSSRRIPDMQAQLAPLLAKSTRPLVFHSPGVPAPSGLETLARLGGLHLDLEGFAYAMTKLDDYRLFRDQWLSRRAAESAIPSVATPRVTLPGAGGSLDAAQARALLSAYGVPMAPEALATSASQAVAEAERIGWPVVLKVVSADIPHKTEAGGVALNLTGAAEVEAAYAGIIANARRYAPKARIEGVQIQKMMPPGREMVVGTVNDPDFGPLVMLGFGGIYVEVLRDVVFAAAPLDLTIARDMISRLQGSAILEGVRGEAASDLDALAQVLVAVSDLLAAHPGRIDEIDLNPVLLYPQGQGAVAVDALLVLTEETAPSAAESEIGR
ncbi:Trans-feruloyl-CoA synthase FCS1 [Achromobacter aegrifaciens]|nr:Trans-feruloyl-CoA synthase FCS1 [Achromobacter aegrifaciens]